MSLVHPPSPGADQPSTPVPSTQPRASVNAPSALPVLPVTYPSGVHERRPSFSAHERRPSVSLSLGPLLINQLKGGSIFLKHGARGSPHYRYVWLSSDHKFIHWGDLKSRRIHGSLACDALMSVQRGHASSLFMQRAPKNSNPSFCFSLQSTARTLDLECSNEQERDLWAKAFDYLIQEVKAKSLVCPEPEAGEQQPSLVEALEILSSNYQATQGPAPGHTMPSLTEINEEIPPSRSRSGTINGKFPPQSSQTITNLYGWLDEAQSRIDHLEKENELYKEDNRKLMVSYAKKMIKLQETIDSLRHDNERLQGKLCKAADGTR